MLVLEGHQGPVRTLAFSPDGQLLASAGKDGVVRLWDAPQVVAELNEAEGEILCLVFSTNGSRVAAGGHDRTARVWEVARKTLIQRMPGQSHAVTALAFLPNDQTLTVGCGNPVAETHMARSLFLWDVQSQKVRESGLYETQGVRAMAAHHPSRMLAYALDRRQIVVRDLLRPTPVCAFSMRNNCSCLAISLDGKWLAAGLDWKIHLFDLQRKQERQTLSGHKGVVTSLAFSPDGSTLLSGGGGDMVMGWDVASGQQKQTYCWPVGRIHAVTFAPDGLRAAAGGGEGKIVVWDFDE